MKPQSTTILQAQFALILTETHASITAPQVRPETFQKSDHVPLYGNDNPKRLEAAGYKEETPFNAK